MNTANKVTITFPALHRKITVSLLGAHHMTQICRERGIEYTMARMGLPLSDEGLALALAHRRSDQHG